MILRLNFPPTVDFAVKHAELVVESARKVSGVVLDFSPANLARVDEIIEGLRRDGVDADQIAETLFSFGCYLGEVFVRNTDARWVNANATKMKDLAGFPIVLKTGTDSVCNPIGKVFKRMIYGDADSVEFFYRAFARTNSTAPLAETVPVRKTGFWSRLFCRRKN